MAGITNATNHAAFAVYAFVLPGPRWEPDTTALASSAPHQRSEPQWGDCATIGGLLDDFAPVVRCLDDWAFRADATVRANRAEGAVHFLALAAGHLGCVEGTHVSLLRFHRPSPRLRLRCVVGHEARTSAKFVPVGPHASDDECCCQDGDDEHQQSNKLLRIHGDLAFRAGDKLTA